MKKRLIDLVKKYRPIDLVKKLRLIDLVKKMKKIRKKAKKNGEVEKKLIKKKNKDDMIPNNGTLQSPCDHVCIVLYSVCSVFCELTTKKFNSVRWHLLKYIPVPFVFVIT